MLPATRSGYSPELKVDSISAGYGPVAIVKDVGFEIAAGRVTVLVGPNGCGKSTLLSTIARLLRPSEGSVILDGRSIHEQPTKDVARRLGILPQTPILPEGLTVFDLVSRGRYPHQGLIRQWSEQDEAAVERALALTETQEFSRRPVDTLSGGQRQRVWIAMALAQETPIILLDEPTTFLDLRYQVEVLELLQKLTRDHGRTVVVVLHELNLAASYADVMIMMKNGQVRNIVYDKAEFTAAMISDVFDIDVHLMRHPDTGVPVFIPAFGQRGAML